MVRRTRRAALLTLAMINVFTLAAGIVSEVYYPTIDRPQIRDLQFLITDGKTFFHDERRHLFVDRRSTGDRWGYVQRPATNPAGPAQQAQA